MDVSPFALSRLFSDLLGRRVQVIEAPATKPPSTAPGTVGIFTVHPQGSSIVLKADTLLLGSLGGALAGLPEALVKQQVSGTLDEILLDAMHEVLNVTSSVLTSRGRAVLQTMVTEASQAEDITWEIAGRAVIRLRYMVSMNGYPGGEISLISAT